MKERVKSTFIRYTSLSGRLGRLQYFLMTLRLYIIEELFLIAIIFASYLADALSLFLFLITYPLILWANMAITVRRMHDINLSGWWLVILIPILLFTLAEYDIGTEDLQTIFATMGMLLVIALIIVFYFKKGSKEKNKYGPPPV